MKKGISILLFFLLFLLGGIIIYLMKDKSWFLFGLLILLVGIIINLREIF